MQSIHATYQEGVFRPLVPVALPEGSEVELHIVPVGSDQATTLPAKGASTTIEDRLAQIASQVSQEDWDELPTDLSQNIDLHLYGTHRE